jgi:hypothetical protein
MKNMEMPNQCWCFGKLIVKEEKMETNQIRWDTVYLELPLQAKHFLPGKN